MDNEKEKIIPPGEKEIKAEGAERKLSAEEKLKLLEEKIKSGEKMTEEERKELLKEIKETVTMMLKEGDEKTEMLKKEGELIVEIAEKEKEGSLPPEDKGKIQKIVTKGEEAREEFKTTVEKERPLEQEFKLPDLEKAKEKNYPWVEEAEKSRDFLIEQIKDARENLRQLKELKENSPLHKKIQELAYKYYETRLAKGEFGTAEGDFEAALRDFKNWYGVKEKLLERFWQRLEILSSEEKGAKDKVLIKESYLIWEETRQDKIICNDEARKKLLRKLGQEITDEEIRKLIEEEVEKLEKKPEEKEKEEPKEKEKEEEKEKEKKEEKEKEEEEEGKKKEEEPSPPPEIGEETIRERINAGKILSEIKEQAEKKDWSKEKIKEEIDKALAQAKFAELENFKKDEKFKTILEKVVENFGKELSAEERKKIIEEIRETIGLSQERIEQAFINLEKKFSQLTEQEVMADKKKKGILSKVATFAKIPLYAGASIGAFLLAGPLGIVGVGTLRYTEATFLQKARKKEIERKRTELGEKILKGDKIKGLLFNELAGELATAKQEQIDKRDERIRELEKELQEKENAYLEFCKGKKGKIEKEKVSEYKEYLKAREKVKSTSADYIKDYLRNKWPEISEDDLNKRVNEALALFELDENNHLYSREMAVKNPDLWTKIVNRTEKILGCKWLKGGEDLKERVLTGAVFAGLGFLSRSGLPGLNRVFMAYGGMKLAEIGTDWLVLRGKKYEVVKDVFAEQLKASKEGKGEVSDETIERVRTQLFADKKFKEKYPTEHGELWQLIDQIEQEKIKKAEKLEDLIKERNETLEQTFIKKMKIDKKAKVIRNGARIGGALLGALAPEIVKGIKELIEEKPPVKGEITKVPLEEPPSRKIREEGIIEKEVLPPEEVKKVPQTVISGKGDNLWKTTERWLAQNEEFKGLNRAQKDYMIDFYSDRIYDQFKAGDTEWLKEFGLDPSKGFDFVREGMELNYSLLDKPEFFESAYQGATGLSPEQMANILEKREIIGEIYDKIGKGEATGLDKAILENLIGYERIGAEARQGFTAEELHHIFKNREIISNIYNQIEKGIPPTEQALATLKNLMGLKGMGAKASELFTNRLNELTDKSQSLINEMTKMGAGAQEVATEATKLSESVAQLENQLNEQIDKESGFIGFFRKLFTGSKVPNLREQFIGEHFKYNETIDELKEIIGNLEQKSKGTGELLKRLEILDPEKVANFKEVLKKMPDLSKVLNELLAKRGILI